MSADALDELTPLRRPPGLAARIGSRLFRGIDEVESTREAFARYWDDRNKVALTTRGPLWLVLGDSLSQGIGASTPSTGMVGVVASRLDERSARPWRVLNLSMTGAKIADVVEQELPLAKRLGVEADLVTCIVGANDVQNPLGIGQVRSDVERLVAELPTGTIVGKVGSGPISGFKARVINGAFGSAGHLRYFDPWKWPSVWGTTAADKFHPNDKGHGFLADRLWQIIGD